jgi:sugar/nucleoside kinase (ribokinase family)
MSLLVSGTVALDNVKTPLGEKRLMLGGSASHFCMSASLFTKVSLSGVIGQDFPSAHIELFKRKKVDLSSLMRLPGKTFQWDGEYKKGDLNSAITLATELGVLGGFKPCIALAQRRLPYVFLANDDPQIQAQVLDQMIRPRFVGLDSMNLWITHKRKELLELIKKVDLFVANDREAFMLSGEDNLIKAAKYLRQLGPALIVIKKGEHGVLFDGAPGRFAFPSFPVEEVVDPTGAGDTFAGGLMGFLAQAKKIDLATLKKGICYATVLASFNVEGFGVQTTSRLTKAMIQKRLKHFIKFISL